MQRSSAPVNRSPHAGLSTDLALLVKIDLSSTPNMDLERLARFTVDTVQQEMSPRHASRIVVAAACGLGVLAFISPFLPPMPVIGWFAASFIIAPFDAWWYALPADARSPLLYTTVGTVAEAVYPAVVAIIFWFWCRPLRKAGSRYPGRTVALAAIAVFLSAAYYATWWRYGLRYQGVGLMITYLIASAATLGVLVFVWHRYRPTGAWWPSLVLHWILFAWICVAAFPWLGEMI